MNLVMKIRNNKINLKIITLFSISLLGFYFLNLYTNFALDDFLYNYILNLNPDSVIRPARVESISDLITSQYNHYFVQNGRIILNGLAQLFLMSENKLWFNIVNTLLFGLFQFLILRRSTSLNIKNVYQYLLLVIALWFLIPSPNQTFLWLTGSINYMWGIFIVLLFLDSLDRINLKNHHVKTKYVLLILIFGFLAGFTHEGITIGVSGALCIAVAKNFKQYKTSSLILIFGFLLGTFVMVIAPGNMIRFNDSSFENTTLASMILHRSYSFIIHFKHNSAFWLMIVLFSVLYFKDRSGFKKIYREHELLIHSIFISLGFLFFVDGFRFARTSFGISVFSIIIILSISQNYYETFFNNKSRILYGILLIFIIIEFSQLVSELRANKIVFDREEKNWFKSDENVFVINEKNKNRFALVNPGEKSSRYSYPNKSLSWYYKKDFMMFISKDLYDNVYKSNKFVSDKYLLTTELFKHSSGDIKLYKSPKNDFLLYKVPDSITENILEGARVKYKSNKVIQTIESGYFNRVKSVFGFNQVRNISSEMASCFLLPTPYGHYLVLKSPSVIPFENLEEIIIYPSFNDTTPILSL
jgi:hypothetical protein